MTLWVSQRLWPVGAQKAKQDYSLTLKPNELALLSYELTLDQ